MAGSRAYDFRVGGARQLVPPQCPVLEGDPVPL